MAGITELSDFECSMAQRAPSPPYSGSLVEEEQREGQSCMSQEKNSPPAVTYSKEFETNNCSSPSVENGESSMVGAGFAQFELPTDRVSPIENPLFGIGEDLDIPDWYRNLGELGNSRLFNPLLAARMNEGGPDRELAISGGIPVSGYNVTSTASYLGMQSSSITFDTNNQR